MDRGLIAKKLEGSYAKLTGADRYLVCLTRARVDSARPIRILRPGIAERGAGRRNPPETKLRGGEFVGVVVRALQRVIRAAIWCYRTRATCVVHWDQKRGTARLCVMGATAAVAPRREVRRRACVHAFPPRFCVQRMWLCALRCCKPKQGQRGTVQRCREPAMADLRRARRRNAGER